MEAIKTPNDMSDKAEKHLRKLNIHAATSRAVRFPTKEGIEYTLHELMQSYAEQHLEDVLVEEIENLEHQLKVEGFETSFELQIASDRRRCLKVTLNLLKQRKG